MIDREKFKENFKYYDKEVIVQEMDILANEHARRLANFGNQLMILTLTPYPIKLTT